MYKAYRFFRKLNILSALRSELLESRDKAFKSTRIGYRDQALKINNIQTKVPISVSIFFYENVENCKPTF